MFLVTHRGKARYLPILALICLILASCGQIKYVPVVEVKHDSTIVTKLKVDSVYFYKDRFVEKGKDTIYIKEVEYKYKYQLLRDTLVKVQVDSIPYKVEVEKIIEVPRKRTWFDYISYVCLGLVIGALITWICKKKLLPLWC